MKTEIDYTQAPHNYTICLNQECLQADTCLRQLVERSIPDHIQRCSVVMPKYLASLKGACPLYHSSAKVRFAQGFIKMIEHLPYKQMRMVIAQLSAHFGRRTYYRVRKGERLLSPSEQRSVLDILKSCGVSHPQEFDAYIELYNW
ncbi:hypothetical protein D0T50_05565 [Bacteroides sp. 214]|uniref:DUF6078 family protein n=1 Tax=Bacteroides sp. 214 TaxID=2302935 RepID=UPI0013D1614D|nr:DUF6078 family protein [Bacteroides sp. 214]NDW12357.1 hypothetical protein [Bacteroides sp. 214]